MVQKRPVPALQVRQSRRPGFGLLLRIIPAVHCADRVQKQLPHLPAILGPVLSQFHVHFSISTRRKRFHRPLRNGKSPLNSAAIHMPRVFLPVFPPRLWDFTHRSPVFHCPARLSAAAPRLSTRPHSDFQIIPNTSSRISPYKRSDSPPLPPAYPGQSPCRPCPRPRVRCR